MPDHIGILVLAVGGFLAFLVFKGVQWARARKEERLRSLRALGFEPRDPVPPEVAEPLLALHDGKAKVTEAFERSGSADRLYLFDLKDSSSESTAHDVLAVFSPRLHLPRLTITPRIEGDGRLAALGNLFLQKLARCRGKAVVFPSHPRFGQRHFVIAPDEEAVRRFLTPERLDRLEPLEHMIVEGEGGVFSYRRIRFGQGDKRETDPHAIAERVREAEELLRALWG